jgi:hypothetical protein
MEDRPIVLINPGSGPVKRGPASVARRNIGAFCRDLALPKPSITIRALGADNDGRYDFQLTRGIRKTVVSMPALALDRVRYYAGANPWNFPRLYVDGSSWLWEFAVNCAKDDLLDHDGSAEAGYKRSKEDVAFVLEHEPRCPACGSIKDEHHSGRREENSPYGYVRVRCLVCVPVERDKIVTSSGGVFVDDSWRTHRGPVYRVHERFMPYEALGTDEDPICSRGHFYGRQCRLRAGHEGGCEPRWKELSREQVTGG